METKFSLFEAIVRRSTDADRKERGLDEAPSLHPFEARNIHAGLPPKVRRLFDDGHYAEATFEAFKWLDKAVQKAANSDDFGFSLMMDALKGDNPKIRLNDLSTETEREEQEGYRFLLGGSVKAIRNPRGHEINLRDDPETCLDHLVLASLLARRIDRAIAPKRKTS